MEQRKFQVSMFGNFSIKLGSRIIDDSGNRTHKVWLLLAYILYNHQRPVSPGELYDLMWEGDIESVSNPQNALRAILHRVRAALDQLGDDVGHELIQLKSRKYVCNPQVKLSLDTEDFEKLCRAGDAEAGEDTRLELYQRALVLYQGDFLSRLSGEAWVRPLAAYYHSMYIQTVTKTIPLLEARGLRQEAVRLCRAALKVEPYSEELYLNLIRNLLALKEHNEVVLAYEKMSAVFLSEFGITPSDEVRSLYYEAVKSVNGKAVPIETLQEQLKETAADNGPMVCDYDFFKTVYQSTARSIERSGFPAHLALLTLSSRTQKELSAASLERAMDNLEGQIRLCLRRGDSASRCSSSQFALILPQANYENSRMVCERLVRLFTRQYPHSPAELTYIVQAIAVKT